MEPDFGSWQTPDISRSHLYRGTIAWTPPTAIYRAYTVYVICPGSCDNHFELHDGTPAVIVGYLWHLEFTITYIQDK